MKKKCPKCGAYMKEFFDSIIQQPQREWYFMNGDCNYSEMEG